MYDACTLLLAFLPSLLSFFAWSDSNSDVNVQFVHALEFFELFLNCLLAFATEVYFTRCTDPLAGSWANRAQLNVGSDVESNLKDNAN